MPQPLFGYAIVLAALAFGLLTFLFLGAILLRSGHDRCVARRAGGPTHV